MRSILIASLVFELLPNNGGGTKPVLDLSNNMRHVDIPGDTRAGTVIYRLRGSDADDNYPLSFSILDKSGSSTSIVKISNTSCFYPVCTADVVLTSAVQSGELHRLSLSLTDTEGERTTVDSILNITKPLTAFDSGDRFVIVPESAALGTKVASFTLRNNPDIYRGVSCFLKQVFPVFHPPVFFIKTELAPDSLTVCSIYLQSTLDYERVSSHILQIVAENAWTNTDFDSRNVATTELLVAVQNVADTPPIFIKAPPVTRLAENAKVGDFVLEVQARDGDSGIGRKIRYTLDNRYNSLSSFFNMDADTGRMTVKQSLQELGDQYGPGQPIFLRIIIQEVEDPDHVMEKLNRVEDQSESTVVAILVDDVINRTPRFLQERYITSIEENASEGTRLKFDGGLDKVEDLDKGQNGVLKLSIEGNEDIFEISPPVIKQYGQFVISVKNNRRLDKEKFTKLEFKVRATEMGDQGLSTTADVLVNILDINDNSPVFTKREYKVTIYENVSPGTKIAQVQATDQDSGEYGKVEYTKIDGDPVMVRSLDLDKNTGVVTVTDNSFFDREIKELYIMTVEARDSRSRSNSRAATAKLIIHVEDVNDVPPRFKKRKYEGFMSPDLTRLRNDLQVEAVDQDKLGTQNSRVRYEIIKGNYEKKFMIDEQTGVISVSEPLITPTSGRASRALPADEVDPIITLLVRAYDLGVPSLHAEVPVNIFTQDVTSRIVKFIIPEPVDRVEAFRSEIADLISTITGGEAEIQDIEPYSSQHSSLQTLRLPHNRRIDTDLESTSVVDVAIKYHATSVVDVDAIKSRLVDPDGIVINRTASSAQIVHRKQTINDDTWLYIVVGLIAVFLILLLVLLISYCCPGCLCYKGVKNKISPATTEDIQVLSVKNGAGHDVQDARFVEILKSARTRLKSATNSAKGRREAWSGDPRKRRWKLLSRGTERFSDDGQIKVKVIEDEDSREGSNIYILQEGLREGGTYILKAFSDTSGDSNSTESLRRAEIARGSVPYYEEQKEDGSAIDSKRSSIPQDRGRIFKVIDHDQRKSGRESTDVELTRVEHEEETKVLYTKMGNAEVLTLDPKSLQGLSERRARSEQDLHCREDSELYTTIGPDGKEIILRRYLNDQSDPAHQMGFVNQALGHLQLEKRLETMKPSDYESTEASYRESREEGNNTDRSPTGVYIREREKLLYDEDPRRNQHRFNRQGLAPRVRDEYVDPRDEHAHRQQLDGEQGRYSDPGEYLDQRRFQDERYTTDQRRFQDERYATDQRQYYEDRMYEDRAYEDYTDPRLYSKDPRRFVQYNSQHRPDNDTVEGGGRYMQEYPEPDRQNLPPSYQEGGNRRFSKPNQSREQEEFELTPKHKIRTPIIEETASGIERALRSRENSRTIPRFASSQNLSNLSEFPGFYDFEESPDPQYTETKSSLLRRKNSKAKLSGTSRDTSLTGQGSYRKFNSLSDLNIGRKISDFTRRRRNSWSESGNLKRSWNMTENGSSQPASHRDGQHRRFTQYTGTGPKDKIEYSEYRNPREDRLEGGSKRYSTNRTSQFEYEKDIPSLEFTFDNNGDIVSTSSLDKSSSRRREKYEVNTTPRYMDWYTKQQQQQKEQQLQRHHEMQEMQRQRQLEIQHLREQKQLQLQQRQMLQQQLSMKQQREAEGREEERLRKEQSENQQHNEDDTDDAKLRRLSTAEREQQQQAGEETARSEDVLSESSEDQEDMEIKEVMQGSPISAGFDSKTRPFSAEVLPIGSK